MPGGEIVYDVGGSGSAPAVVFLHGAFMDRRSWDRQVPRFARRLPRRPLRHPAVRRIDAAREGLQRAGRSPAPARSPEDRSRASGRPFVRRRQSRSTLRCCIPIAWPAWCSCRRAAERLRGPEDERKAADGGVRRGQEWGRRDRRRRGSSIRCGRCRATRPDLLQGARRDHAAQPRAVPDDVRAAICR